MILSMWKSICLDIGRHQAITLRPPGHASENPGDERAEIAGRRAASWYIRPMTTVMRRDDSWPAVLALVPLAVIAIGFFVPPVLFQHSRPAVESLYAEGGSPFL